MFAGVVARQRFEINPPNWFDVSTDCIVQIVGRGEAFKLVLCQIGRRVMGVSPSGIFKA